MAATPTPSPQRPKDPNRVFIVLPQTLTHRHTDTHTHIFGFHGILRFHVIPGLPGFAGILRFHGVSGFHGILGIPWSSMDSMDFHGALRNSMECLGMPWIPCNSMESNQFHGITKEFMESIETYGIHATP